MPTKILINFLILIVSIYIIIKAEPITPKADLINFLDCASSIPCVNTTAANNTTITTSLPPTPSTVATSPKPICPNCPNPDCSMVTNGTTFPYANHCRLFYMCIGGSAQVCTCPNGEWYDRYTFKCAKCELVTNCIANTD